MSWGMGERDAQEIKRLKEDAHERRAVLERGDCSTYIWGVRAGFRVIVCLCCGFASSKEEDMRDLKCRFCGEKHLRRAEAGR
jgi:hypothetical protein